jgi:dTDP-4-amino-4,6-dideoxygalactose transaminase
VITTGDGGMITTRNPEWDAKFRLWRQHAMSVPDTVRHGAREVIFETYPEPGFNYRMTDLQAAVGREQLKRLRGLVDERRAMAGLYSTRLAGIAGIQPPAEPEWARSNWQSYCVRLAAGLDQRAIMQDMLDQGVSTRRGVMCSHLEAPYADRSAALPHSEAAQNTGIILPLYPGMEAAQVARVCEALGRAVGAQLAAPVAGEAE